MEGPNLPLPLPARSDLSHGAVKMLQRGTGSSADVLLVERATGPIVIKDYARRPTWIRLGLGRWSLAREERAYRRLSGVAAVPRWLGRIDADAIAIEYRPGTLLSRSLAGEVPSAFVGELEAGVAAMHERGIVHLDLRHRSNVLAGEDGHPVLIDFASALFFDPSARRGRIARALFAWIDRRALEKWRVRLRSADASAEADAETLGAAPRR